MDFFIPKTYQKQQISIRVDQETLLRIDDLSAKSGISRSELINQCINYALNTMNNNSIINGDLGKVEVTE